MAERDPFDISGKHVLLTGGTAGIGKAVAVHFVQAGAKVVITGRRAEGHKIANEMGATFVEMDMAQSQSIHVGTKKAASSLNGRIDVLVLNAGIDLNAGSIDGLDIEAFKQVFAVNVFGVVQGLRDALPFMNDGASVIITSSPAGSKFAPGMSAYSASKAAINALIKTYALELGPRKIRVNGTLPGIVESEMNGSSPATDVIRTLTATGTVRRGEEMGPIFQFLASDASESVTGGLLGCDDGLTAGLSAELMQKAFE